MATLETLRFDNRYSRLPEDFFEWVEPTPFARPHLVAANPDAAALIGLDAAARARPAFVRRFAGAEALPGADPIAMLYAGHPFGTWVPRLGDGWALLLGEVVARRQTDGFVHAVLSRYHMSVPGISIDHGPSAFIDRYNALRLRRVRL